MEKNNSHLAGEYFVAAELYRRGFSIGMTIGNAKAIDLFANKDDRTVSIQVKAIRNKKSIGWPIMKSHVKSDIIYIFVNLNDQAQPEYFVAISNEIIDKIKQYTTRGIIDITKLHNDQFINRWDKIESILNTS